MECEEEEEEEEELSPIIAVRSNFNPLANFTPAVKVGSDGTTEIALKVPDNLTRYRCPPLLPSHLVGTFFGWLAGFLTASVYDHQGSGLWRQATTDSSTDWVRV